MPCICTGRDTVGGDGGISVRGIVTLEAGGGMFTLGDAGVAVTLGDAWGIFTRRGSGGIILTVGCEGMMFGSKGLAMALSNILARSTMTCCWASLN